MKFGRLPHTAFDQELPPWNPVVGDASSVKDLLEEGNLYAGASQWSQGRWKAGLKAEGKTGHPLTAYSRLMNTVELNSTYYGFPNEQQLQKWRTLVRGTSLKFCPKIHRSISQRPGSDQGAALQSFFQKVQCLEPHLGPSFLQLSDLISLERWEGLRQLLAYKPADTHFMVEMRHASWFEDTDERHKWMQTMLDTGVGAVLTDAPARRDLLHMAILQDQLLVRFVGSGDLDVDRNRIQKWRMHLQRAPARLKALYFIFHVDPPEQIPGLVDILIGRSTKKRSANTRGHSGEQLSIF